MKALDSSVIPPLAVRKLRAAMQLKHLSLETVAKRAGVSYSRASDLLRGRLICPRRLEQLRRVIESAPTP